MGEMVGHLVLFVLFLCFFIMAVCDLVRVLTCLFLCCSMSLLCIFKLLLMSLNQSGCVYFSLKRRCSQISPAES